MITLGLDPSMTAFGWCLHDSSQVGPKRILARGLYSTSSKEVFVKRYMLIRQWLCGLIVQHPEIQGVGVESIAFGEYYSEGMYALFCYVNEVLYTHRKDVIYFDPQTLKALVKQDPKIRKGKMFKSDMVTAAREDTGIKGRFNHNEADAYHLARFAARFWDLDRGVLHEEDLTPSEHHTFMREHTYKRGKRAGQTVREGTLYRENDRFFRFSLLE